MVYCKICGKPIMACIEGEPICPDCREQSEWGEEEWKVAKEIEWFRTHCPACAKVIPLSILEKNNGFCSACNKENQEFLEQ